MTAKKPAEIRENVLIGPMTTYRIGGPAHYYAKPANRESLLKVLLWARDNNQPIFILGAGSNVLFSERGFAGLVVHLLGFNDQFEAQLINAGSGEWEVSGGAILNRWIRRAIWGGFSGLEALIGIPGTVGGALRMNAGAFSVEIGERLSSVEVICQNLEIERINAAAIRFAYRQAPELADTIILGARFQLDQDDPRKLLRRIREIVALRRQRQPLKWPSCGSVFKRPPGDFAGRLIEACGLKGFRQGGAQISTLHANFIINLGGASADDVLQLIKIAKNRVKEHFGITLEREVELVGFSGEELEGT